MLCSWVTPTPCLSCTLPPALPVFSLALEVRGQSSHRVVKWCQIWSLKHVCCLLYLAVRYLSLFSLPPSLPFFLSTELVGEAALSIQASEKVTSISLPLTPPYHTLEFQLEVLCHIPLSPARVENERLTNGEIHHRPKSRTRFNSGMACIDQKVWWLSRCNKNCNELNTWALS